MAAHHADFDVYGFRFRVSFEGAEETGAMLAADFAFFRRDRVENPMPVRIHENIPPYEQVPPRVATVYTPRNIAFTEGDRTYVDYSGRALVIYHRSEPREYDIYSLNTDLLYEATYLFLLSRIGEFLDTREMHRIHAMALSFNGKAVLAALPMGGGKSTLCAELLKSPDFKFLSDDSPFLSADGHVHAFPLRLGLLPGEEATVPEDQRRTIQRMEFGPKVLVNFDYLAPRVAATAAPGIVFLGYRSLAPECRIEPAGSMEIARSMLANCVVGLGLYQGLEFVMRASASELAGKARIGWSRWKNARALCGQSGVYRLILGRNRELNGQTVIDFVRKQLG